MRQSLIQESRKENTKNASARMCVGRYLLVRRPTYSPVITFSHAPERLCHNSFRACRPGKRYLWLKVRKKKKSKSNESERNAYNEKALCSSCPSSHSTAFLIRIIANQPDSHHSCSLDSNQQPLHAKLIASVTSQTLHYAHGSKKLPNVLSTHNLTQV